MDNKFSEFILGCIIIYFGIKGNAAAEYFSNFSTYLDDKDGFIVTLMIWLYTLNPLANIVIVIAIIISWFLTAVDDEEGPYIAIVLWPILGWWVGSAYHDALVEKQSCVTNSTFGIGCNLDAPFISGLLYGGVSV